MRAGVGGDDDSRGVRGECSCDCSCACTSAEETVGRSAGEGKGGKRNVDGGCGAPGVSSCNIGVVGGVGCGVGLTTTTRGNGASPDAGSWTSGTSGSQSRDGCTVGGGVDNTTIVVVAEVDLRWGGENWFGNMSTMKRPTQTVDLPRVQELTVDAAECGDIRGRSGVDGGSIMVIGGGNGDGDG